MEDTFESARRELCPDGACIGLIGPDGRCKVCGQVSPSAVADPRHRGMVAPGDDSDGAAFDDGRELCPDGACIGVLGEDDRCKVCGAQGAPRAGAGAAAGADAAPDADPPVAPAGAAAAAAASSGEPDVDDEDRELCPDGACIGLIGPDGRCKECGTARA
ncbi:MAG TPA: hypothetical protein VKZ63_19565 [Kofleriaceae bacterium]|nr:hypothetical protein [Kofleriaceae bacterium]